MDDQSPNPSSDLDRALSTAGPLDRPTALALLERGRALLEAGDYELADTRFRRVAMSEDAPLAAAALLGLGEARFRLDRESEAVAAWEGILALPETPSTYAAWRNVAAARVRAGDLAAAAAAYREAERRAPAEDRPEIASRLGWLAKESGDQRSARRYFARSRGDGPAVPVAYLILGVTIVVSFYGLSADGQAVARDLALDKAALAHGELYRLVSPVLVHLNILHLAVNMYALYLLGPLVEGLWGSATFGAIYVLTAAGASTVSFLSGSSTEVGASGALFGLIGVLIAGSILRRSTPDPRIRGLAPRLLAFAAVLIAAGFAFPDSIDNGAHIGGLAAGLWLGLFLPPVSVSVSASGAVRRASSGASPGQLLIGAVGVAALLVAVAGGLIAGGVRIG